MSYIVLDILVNKFLKNYIVMNLWYGKFLRQIIWKLERALLEAAKWLVEQGLAKSINSKRHIIDCCNNKCPHAYHYIWKYGEIPSL